MRHQKIRLQTKLQAHVWKSNGLLIHAFTILLSPMRTTYIRSKCNLRVNTEKPLIFDNSITNQSIEVLCNRGEALAIYEKTTELQIPQQGKSSSMGYIN